MKQRLNPALDSALNKFAKWRMVFASWQLGTRGTDDPECQAVRDHREVTMLLRAEVNAITALLFQKGIFTPEEFGSQLLSEVKWLDAAFEGKFPGFSTTEDGVTVNVAQARETMKSWKP